MINLRSNVGTSRIGSVVLQEYILFIGYTNSSYRSLATRIVTIVYWLHE